MAKHSFTPPPAKPPGQPMVPESDAPWSKNTGTSSREKAEDAAMTNPQLAQDIAADLAADKALYAKRTGKKP
jgi:hypothetical protein